MLAICVWITASFAVASAASIETVNSMQAMTDMNLKGIDVSHWNGTIDWGKVKASGISFSYLKATEGNALIDSSFAVYVKDARNAGMPIGAFHYARPSSPVNLDQARSQAQFFVTTMKQNGLADFGDIMPVLDLEEPGTTGTLNGNDLAKWARTFVDTVKTLTNRQVMLYTGTWFVQQYDGFAGALSDLPLWAADYTYYGDTQPPVCGGWANWIVWQHTDKGTVSGITGQVDLDAGPISLDELKGSMPTSPQQSATTTANSATGASTEQPATTAPAPAAPTQQPATTAPAPAAPTQQPATTAPAPAAPTQQPATSVPAPAAPTQQPATTAPAPAAPTQQPATTAPAPAAPMQQPATTAPAPAAPMQQPATTAPAPAAPTQQPGTTAPASVTRQPATPGNFTVRPVSANSVTLSWQAVPGADTYTLLRNGKEVYTGTKTWFTDVGLKPMTSYNYSIMATKAGVKSKSKSLSAVTPKYKLAVDVITSYATNSHGKYVKITATVKDGNSRPVPGAVVKVMLKNPSGRVHTLNGKTNTKGVLIQYYYIPRTAKGNYKVSYSASLMNSTPAYGNRTLMVK